MLYWWCNRRNRCKRMPPDGKSAPVSGVKMRQNGPCAKLKLQKKNGSKPHSWAANLWGPRKVKDFLGRGGATAWASRWLFKKKKSSRTIHSPRRLWQGQKGSKLLCNPSCGTRRKTSLERRFSADRCAVIASLYLPQAALTDNARHSVLEWLLNVKKPSKIRLFKPYFTNFKKIDMLLMLYWWYWFLNRD